ncbi:hypothetical protein GS540_29675 [Rhodococcus hoagii]|nr:hypothetical protein [Prescottella equi]
MPELTEDVPSADQLNEALGRAAERLGAHHLLIVVDQIEELFSQCSDADERAAFLTVLDLAATAPVGGGATDTTSVVATMRSDFYPQGAHPSGARAGARTAQQGRSRPSCGRTSSR